MGSNPGYDDDLAPTRRLPALDPWGRPVEPPEGAADASPHWASPPSPTPDHPARDYPAPTYAAPTYPPLDDGAPTYPAPASYTVPSYQPPHETPPAGWASAWNPPAPPAYGSPAYGSPAYGPPAYGPPAYGPPSSGFAPPGPSDIPVAPGAPAPSWWPPVSTAPPPRPATHVVGAVLATVLLCWPLGAVALVNALRVDDLWRAGDITGARRASDRARSWTVWAVMVGLVWVTFWALYALTRR